MNKISKNIDYVPLTQQSATYKSASGTRFRLYSCQSENDNLQK